MACVGLSIPINHRVLIFFLLLSSPPLRVHLIELMHKRWNSNEKRRKLSRETATEYDMFRERRVTIRETEELPRQDNNEGESAIIEVHTKEVEPVIED